VFQKKARCKRGHRPTAILEWARTQHSMARTQHHMASFFTVDSLCSHLGRTVSKTVRPMLSDRCLSCLSVCPVLPVLSECNVGVLWPNGWMHQDENWHAGMPRPWLYIVLDEDPALPPQRGTASQFSAHICCGRMAGWIKTPLCTKAGLGPGEFVLDGDPAAPPRKGAEPSPQFSAHVHCGQTA